jgi:hypothetical protein
MTNNYLNAYNKMFGKFINQNNTTEQDGDVYVIKNSFEIDHNIEIYHGYIECIFQNYQKGFKLGSTSYKCDCTLNFSRITQDKIKEILNQTDYNYDLIYEVVNDFFKIGQEFKIYKNIKVNKKIQISNFFDLSVKKSVPVANLTPDAIFDNEYFSIHPIIADVNFKMENKKSNEIHPIIELKFPYAHRKFAKLSIDLHPSKKSDQINQLVVEKEIFKAVLEKELESKIQRYLDMSVVDVSQMSLDQKLNYILVLEMSKI